MDFSTINFNILDASGDALAIIRLFVTRTHVNERDAWPDLKTYPTASTCFDGSRRETE